MQRKTPTYRLEYLTRGSSYSGLKDYRRFTTIDSHLDSYTGIVGVGVINGWTVEPTNVPLQVKILPGSGMIDGFYSESDYTYIQRSDMVSGQREIEVVEDNNVPEPYLTNAQRATYVSIRQEYEPSYNPSGPIINSYIKAYTASLSDGSIMNLADNSDTYVYAKRKYPDPYDDCWNDGFTYPPAVGDKPATSSYKTYSEYKVAMEAYKTALATMRDFEWRSVNTNHFTAVEFDKTANFIKSSDKVLLAKVVTRSGVVKKIDTKDVDSLANLTASIKEQAKIYIANHTHGGSASYDPPAINLKTDIRRCVLYLYKTVGQTAIFDILENAPTSSNVGHNHTYKIDVNGDGYTVEMTGTDQIHFHKISNFVVGNQETTTASIETHNHTIPTQRDDIDVDSPYIVYVNGIETTNNVSVDFTKRQVTILGLIGEVYKTYYTDFNVTTTNPDTQISKTEKYTFERNSPSLLSFMVDMELDFGKKYDIDQLVTEGTNGFNASGHPFLFTEGDGFAGFGDLTSQATIGQTLMKKVGDQYTFTPNAARNITVLLKDAASTSITDYDVRIKIMGNTEVDGVLREENIDFINAEKIATGQFDLVRLPSVNHKGRMGEEFIPYQYPMVSTDGIRYTVSPAITSTIYDHYHKLYLDESLSGTTNNAYVSEDPVYYEYANGKSYLIAHNHGVVEGIVNTAEGRDLAKWQEAIHGANVTSAVHSHKVIPFVKGDPKVIYSLAETAEGSIITGTSSGVYITPVDAAYLFVVNDVPIYQIGSNLWNSLLKVKKQYEFQTGKELVVTEALYSSSLAEAANVLISDGDTILMMGNITPLDPDHTQDQIMLQKVTSFPLPNFKYTAQKPLNQVTEDETIVDLKLVWDDGTEVTQSQIDSYVAEGSEDILKTQTVKLATVEKLLHNTPMWSIITDSSGEVFVCGSTDYSKISNLEDNLYAEWTYASKPIYASPLKKAFKDSLDNVWFPTEKGLLVARSYQNGYTIETTNSPDISVNVNDVVEGTSGKIYVATNLGICFTTNFGKSWTTALSVSKGFTKILKSSTGKLFAITEGNAIYSSSDGINWSVTGSMLQQSYNDVLIFQNNFFVGTDDGLYSSEFSGGNWTKVLEDNVYSLNLLLNSSGILVGCDKKVYISLNGTTFINAADISGSAAPTLYTSNGRLTLGYAYSSSKQQFFFKEVTYTEDPLSALVDFNMWIAKEGSWKDGSLTDIYIDRQLIYSSERNIDNRQSSNYVFEVEPSQGTLNFGAQTVLTEATNVYGDYIDVSSSDGFGAGDRIFVVSSQAKPEEPQEPEKISDILHYFDQLLAYYQTKTEIENMYFYAEISAVSSKRLFLDRKISTIVTVPADVYKIPNLSGNTSIFANIYDSMLSNIGTNSHDDLDNKTTYASDNRPYHLNNSYLSNLLQLTQAVRYAYPDIDEYMVNTKFFDFRYSWNPLDPDKPYIGDIIDLSSSEAYNEGLYDSNFSSSIARMVNRIFIGHGVFADTIFVATDVGIFYAKIDPTMEYNWFYAYQLRTAVYDLMIVNESKLLAATIDGIYESSDVLNWTLLNQPAISFPIYTFSYRWIGRETVETPSHSVTFSNVNNRGKITSNDLDPLYESIKTNRIIRIVGSTTGKDGDYSVIAVDPYHITVSQTFSNTVPSTETVVIKMGGWWEYLDSDVSTDNPDINNTLMAGGRSMIAFATNVSSTLTANDIIWRQSSLPTDIPKFSTSDISPLTNGTVLSSINGIISNEENDILVCNDAGSTWNRFMDLKAVKGTIFSKLATSSGHTMLKVNYTVPSNYDGEDYVLNGKEVGFFNGSNLLLKSYVIANETREDSHYLIVYGQDVFDLINQYPSLTFTVYPLKVNKIIELSDHNILYATNQGLYTDNGSVINFATKQGEINKVSNGGIVTKIDINGTIKTVSRNPSTNKVILNISSEDEVSVNQLANMILYIVDFSEPIKKTVTSNTSLSVSGEINIELDADYATVWNSYKGKKVTIVGAESKIYLDFDSPISTDQFKNGKLYVSSTEGENQGKSYDIASNTSASIILKSSITPRSTIAANNDSLFVGQTVKLVDSTGRIKLYVTFNEDAELNQFSGASFRLEDSSSLPNISITIYSNTAFEIILNPIAVAETDLPAVVQLDNLGFFSIFSNQFAPVKSFNTKMLSETNDHYHAALLIGQKLKGTINTITSYSSAYMNLTISSTTGFDSEALIEEGTIIDNCKVVLYNPNNMAYSYETTSVLYSGGILRLRTGNSNLWNILAYDEKKISTGWMFIIYSERSGLSQGTYYRDFVTKIDYLTQDITEGNNIVYIASTATINSGDKVELFNSKGKTFITYVTSVLDSQRIELNDSSDNSFLVSEQSGIKVLKDSFSNNHMHKIYNGQVETMVITDYLPFGYPSTHSHILVPYITNVSDAVVSNQTILTVGSSELIYTSYNNGVNWSLVANLNNYLEWNEEVEGISRATINNSQIIVGTTNGQIFSNTANGQLNIPLEKPL